MIQSSNSGTFSRNTYLALHYFVNEKGLNLFLMYPEFNEYEMVIHTFVFSSLKLYIQND